MTPQEVGARLVALLSDAASGRSGGDAASGRSGGDAASGRSDSEAPGRAVAGDDPPERMGGGVEGEAVASAAVAGVSGGQAYARATVDVPAAGWVDAVLAARDDADLSCDFFDWLSAVDELAEGFTVVAHLWSTTRRHGVLLRTRIPREAAAVPSIVGVFPGAAWHERETHEMFGIDFPGHPGLTPLLLPPEFEGNPLRKEFVLASRVAKAWPGAKEPGESESGAARRAPMRPPGVPDPTVWGPQAPPPGPAATPPGPQTPPPGPQAIPPAEDA